MQKIIQGEGAIRQLGPQLAAAGHKSAFVITGNHFRQHMSATLLPGIRTNWFVKSGPDVTEQEIMLACNAYKNGAPPAIVAIGGGSVIDLAKAIIFECINSSAAVPFFVAVPTTAGSGSEATQFAVTYKEKRKTSLVHPLLLPRMVILDPQLTYSLPAFQTAASGMDTLAQAVESYWNIHASADSRSYAMESIGLWQDNFLRVSKGPDPVSRERMLYASHLAGKAINSTRTTGPHALSYYLTAGYGIAHGQAVAIFLPVFFIYNKPQQALCQVLQVNSVEDAKTFLQSVMMQVGLATTFADLGLDKNDIMDDLLDSVNEERFTNNPRPFNKEKLRELFYEYL